MTKIIVADASPLIAFGRLNLIPMLHQTLGSIIIPEAVAAECISHDLPGAAAIQAAISQKILTIHKDPETSEREELENLLDKGEAAAITLALQLNIGILIDEKLGRSAAMNLNLKVIGTAGVLLLAKQKKIIQQVLPIIKETT